MDTENIKIVGKSYFGTEICEISCSERERHQVKLFAKKVTESRALWSKVLPSVTDADRKLYEALYEKPFSTSPSMETVFVVGQCHRNSFFAAWLLNDRSLRATKYELCWNMRHCALRNVHTGRIMDPTLETHPNAAHDSDWKTSSIAMLAHEGFGKGHAGLALTLNTLEEMKGVFEGPYERFLQLAEEQLQMREK